MQQPRLWQLQTKRLPYHAVSAADGLLMLMRPSQFGTPSFAIPVITSKRHLYHYLTKDKKSYEEYRKQFKFRGLRWDKEGAGPKPPMAWIKSGHEDDPSGLQTMDKNYAASPRFGDLPPEQEFFYREPSPPLLDPTRVPFMDRCFSLAGATFFGFGFSITCIGTTQCYLATTTCHTCQNSRMRSWEFRRMMHQTQNRTNIGEDTPNHSVHTDETWIVEESRPFIYLYLSFS